MDKDEYYQKSIAELQKHAETSNKEVGGIQIDVGVIKTDIQWTKEAMNEFKTDIKAIDSRTWWILGSVVIGIGAQILITLLK